MYDPTSPTQRVGSDITKDFKQVQHMLLPRLAALAEIAWAYDRKEPYEVFAKRAKALLPDFYGNHGLHYAPYFFEDVE